MRGNSSVDGQGRRAAGFPALPVCPSLGGSHQDGAPSPSTPICLMPLRARWPSQLLVLSFDRTGNVNQQLDLLRFGVFHAAKKRVRTSENVDGLGSRGDAIPITWRTVVARTPSQTVPTAVQSFPSVCSCGNPFPHACVTMTLVRESLPARNSAGILSRERYACMRIGRS